MLRIGLVLATAVTALWLTAAVGASSTLRYKNPQLALYFAPFDARSQGAAAEVMLRQARDPVHRERAKDAAVRALLRDPTVVPAVRTLGLVTAIEGRIAPAKRLFAYSEQLSRRDLATQLWLIEESVNRNDVAGALGHFDKALRTSLISQRTLIPVLVQATEDPDLIDPIANILRPNPAWRKSFMTFLIRGGKNSDNISKMVREIGSDNELGNAISRFIKEENYQLAWDTYPNQSKLTSGFVNNSNFENAGALGPIDWDYSDSPNSLVERRKINATQGVVLFYSAQADSATVLARQLVRVPPGAYSFHAKVGGFEGAPSDMPRWVIRCAKEEGKSLVDASLSVAKAGTLDARFVVPNVDCEWQWLTLLIDNADGLSVVEGWTDDIRIARDSDFAR